MEYKLFFERGFDFDRECLGQFNVENPVCKTKCVLRLRCAVTKERIARMELIEELTTDLHSHPTIQ